MISCIKCLYFVHGVNVIFQAFYWFCLKKEAPCGMNFPPDVPYDASCCSVHAGLTEKLSMKAVTTAGSPQVMAPSTSQKQRRLPPYQRDPKRQRLSDMISSSCEVSSFSLSWKPVRSSFPDMDISPCFAAFFRALWWPPSCALTNSYVTSGKRRSRRWAEKARRSMTSAVQDGTPSGPQMQRSSARQGTG